MKFFSLQLRFLVPLVVVLVASAYLALPLMDQLTLRWFARDLNIRGLLVTTALSDSILEARGDANGVPACSSCWTARSRTSASSPSVCVHWMTSSCAAPQLSAGHDLRGRRVRRPSCRIRARWWLVVRRMWAFTRSGTTRMSWPIWWCCTT
jgi:hypothetical protein